MIVNNIYPTKWRITNTYGGGHYVKCVGDKEVIPRVGENDIVIIWQRDTAPYHVQVRTTVLPNIPALLGTMHNIDCWGRVLSEKETNKYLLLTEKDQVQQK